MTEDDATAVLTRSGAPPVSTSALGEWMLAQRWFGAKARALGGISILDAVPVGEDADPLLLLIVEVRAPAGTHDLYQLPVGVSRRAEHATGAEICERDGVALYDALGDERQMARLGRLIATGETVSEAASTISFHHVRELALASSPSARRIGGEQSNSSVVLDESYVLKAFRRLEAGIYPELEMLRFLELHGFEHIAPVTGWYAYSGELLETTLGIVQELVPDARDGWELTLDALVAGGGLELLGSLRELGAVTGRMHATLSSDPENT